MEKLVVKGFLILSFLMIGIVGCQDDKSSGEPIVIADELKESNTQLNQLSNEVSRNVILRSADNRSRDLLEEYLTDLSAKVIYLSSFPYDKLQYDNTVSLIRQIQNLPLPLVDRAHIDPIINSTYAAILKLAKKNNVSLQVNFATLFSYDFHSGVMPFYSTSTGQTWVKREGNAVNPQTFAYISSNQFNANKSWLISPQFNFSDLNKAQLKVRHMFNISRGQGNFDLGQIKELGFKLLYSTEFSYDSLDDICYFSDITEKSCENKPQWNELKFDHPDGDNFHTITTRPINLDPLLGEEKVFIALVMNLDRDIQNIVGQHFTSWNVYDFTLEGVGNFPEPILAPEPEPEPEALFKYTFDDKTLKPLIQVHSIDNPLLSWRQSAFRGDGFAAMATVADITTPYKSQLIHPSIDLNLDSAELYLHLNQTIKPNIDGYSVWDRIKVKISKNFKPGQSIESATWEELVIKHSKELEVDRFNNRKIFNIDISKFKGSSVAMSFIFESQTGDNHLWQVSDLEVTGEAKEVK